MTSLYSTHFGTMHLCSAEDFVASAGGKSLIGEVQLILTSPPFPLNHKKRYGNLSGEEYLDWLGELAGPLGDLLGADGSLVIELGNGWESGAPEMSTLAVRSLLAVLDRGGFKLCQQFVCHNPARLPTPAQWVTVERIRVKDSFTHVWWMSRTTRPKADNRRVLVPYSKDMEELLKKGSYNAGRRDSEHRVGEKSFLQDNGGAIPGSVLTYGNTRSSDEYRQYCRQHGLDVHPARMQPRLAEFFVRLCTEPGDLVLDPFAGSNTTGAIAEELGRRWVAIEPDAGYAMGSQGRFSDGAEVNPAAATEAAAGLHTSD